MNRQRFQWAYHLHHCVADHGDISALACLTVLEEETGQRQEAERLYRAAVGTGDTFGMGESSLETLLRRRWPYGLDPDGTSTP